MTTNKTEALAQLRGLVFNSDDVEDLINAAHDRDDETIEAIDDRTEVRRLLDIITADA